MNISKKMPSTRARLMATAVTGVVSLTGLSPAYAQSSIDLDFLNQTFTRLTTSTALVDNFQRDTATNVTANAMASGGTGIDIRVDLLSSSGTDDAINGSYDANRNRIYADAFSNSVTNTISATTSPAFADSSAISSNQINQSDARASAVGAAIVITIEARDVGGDRVRSLQNGSAELVDNSVSSLSNGNTATNTITIDQNISVTGAGGSATSVLAAADVNATVNSVMDLAVDADLVIANAQINDGDISQTVDIYSVTVDTDIGTYIEEVDGSSVLVADNAISASARGNTVSSMLSTGGNAATIDATIALANSQANDSVFVRADNLNSDVFIDTNEEDSGATQDSSLTLDSNAVTAAAYGNNAVQTLSLSANAIVAGNSSAATIGQGGVPTTDMMTATGAVTVSNLQLSIQTDVDAYTSGGDIFADIGDTTQNDQFDRRNTVTVSNNSYDATAVNNRATSQAVSLMGNDVGTGVAVASSQYVEGASDTTAISEDNDFWIMSNADSGSVDSTLSVEGNLDRALAIGNTATTTISIAANNIDVTADPGRGLNGSGSGSVVFDPNRSYDSGDIAEVAGSFITLNDQFVVGDVRAEASDGATYIYMNGGDTENSTLDVSRNNVLSAAISNDATNTITLSLNDVTVGGAGDQFATVAAAMTQQTSDQNITIAQARPDVYILTDNDVFDSTVSTDANTVEAMAVANRATGNILTVNANSIETPYDVTGSNTDFVRIDGDTYDPRASFLVQNAQQASGATVTAYLTNSATSVNTSAEIETILGEDVGRSDISTDLNVLRASATANSAENALALTAGATVETSVGVGNFQETDAADLNAVIGDQGTMAIAYSGFTLTGTTTGGAPFVFTGSTAGLDADQLAYLVATYGSDANYNLNTGAQTISFTAAASTTTISPPAGNVAMVGQDGGAFIRVTDTIDDSTLSVSGNLTEGKLVGNSAQNTVTVDANQVLDGADRTNAAVDDDYQVSASNMAQNTQMYYDTDANSAVYGSFAIDTNTDRAVSGSSLVINGNTQRSSVTANTATTTLSVDATNMRATTGLQNGQDVSATGGPRQLSVSDLWVYAPMAINGSTLDLTNNTSQAQARGNVATNTVSVTATDLNVGGGSVVMQMAGDTSGGVVLGNDQTANAIFDARSSLTVFNEHLTDGTTPGVEDSTITLGGNVSLADSNANRATNTLSLDGTNISSTGALNSKQRTDGSVLSNATARVFVELNDATVGADVVDNSAIAIDGNRTTALATVNQVENSLMITATNVSGSVIEASANPNSVSATFAVGNDQRSSVTAGGTATVTSVEYLVDLNTVVQTGDGLGGSAVSVSGNATTAQALGNRAANVLNADTTNSVDASYAVNSYQENYAILFAAVRDVAGGVNVQGVGTSTDSTISVSSNSSLANAIGNLAGNSMVLNASNMSAVGANTATASGTGITYSLDATGLVRNEQVNATTVRALNDNVVYSAVLNANPGGSAMSGTSVDVFGNSIVSQAMGNSASNSLVVSALAADTATYGVQSSQLNQQGITASVVDSALRMTSYGTVGTSAVSVGMNTIGATATGNIATNLLRR